MTGHSAPLQGLDTASRWSHVSGALGLLCNRWAARRDLIVQMGTDPAGVSTAFFLPEENRIQINANDAFGPGALPEDIGHLTDPEELAKFPVAGGLAMHEASHARWTKSYWLELRGRVESSEEWTVFTLLEETRIEGRAAETHGWDRGLLRASCRALVMKNPEEWEKSPRMAAQLLIGREAVGVLEESDVAPVRAWLLNNGWTPEILEGLITITSEFLLLDDPEDIDEMLSLAGELHALMPEDPEPESDEEGEGVGSLRDAVSRSVSRAAREGAREVQERASALAAEEEREQAERDAREQSKRVRIAEDIFHPNGEPYKVPSDLRGAREPVSAERTAAVQLAKALEKAKYRDRIETEYQSEAPPGRLHGGEAMRRSAAISMNAPAEHYRPFTAHHYEEVDEPPMAVGIMCDVSGSMASVQETVGSAVWVISEAVSRIDRATAAQVYFGDKVYPGLAKGERLRLVRTWDASGGYEEFNRAFQALDGELSLLNGSGARLLFIVSDGQYKREQNTARDKWIQACVNGGVAVVWLALKGDPSVAKVPGLEIVTVETTLLSATNIIGLACTRALARASGIQ